MENTIQLAQCIGYYKEHDLFGVLRKEDIRLFLNDEFGMSLKRALPKADIVRAASDALTEDTVERFAEGLQGFGMPAKGIAEAFEISQYAADKMIKENQIRKAYTIHFSYSNRDWFIYDMLDVAHAKIPRTRRNRSAPIELEMTDDNLAEALYVINKSAKKSRDTKNRAYYYSKHGACHGAKTRMIKLYHLKDAALQKLIDEGRAAFIGIHRQVFNERNQYLAMYGIAGFTFHTPYSGKIPEILLGDIDGKISAERTRNVKINYTQAVNLLEKYSGVSLKEYSNRERDPYY